MSLTLTIKPDFNAETVKIFAIYHFSKDISLPMGLAAIPVYSRFTEI